MPTCIISSDFTGENGPVLPAASNGYEWTGGGAEIISNQMLVSSSVSLALDGTLPFPVSASIDIINMDDTEEGKIGMRLIGPDGDGIATVHFTAVYVSGVLDHLDGVGITFVVAGNDVASVDEDGIAFPPGSTIKLSANETSITANVNGTIITIYIADATPDPISGPLTGAYDYMFGQPD